MKFLGKIFKNGADEVINGVGNILDKTVTNDGEKLQAKEQISRLVLDSLNKLQDMQKEVILSETSGNWLQRSWRPIVMLIFTGIIVLGVFYDDIAFLDQESPFWTILKLGLGGYVIGRSTEKVASTISKNQDITFLRKKDRKDAMG